MRTLAFFTVFFVAVVHGVYSQGRSDKQGMQGVPLRERLVFGGNIGLSFGDVTYIAAEPLVGYRLTPNLVTGIGMRYIYYRDNFYNYTTSIYGGSVFGRYYLVKGIFGETSFELNSLQAYDPLDQQLSRIWVPSWLVGAGYSSSLGRGAGFYFSILYDLLQDPHSPYYRQPVIRLGIGLGL
ncbi:MAG: hypothetical protein RMK52_06340 [Chitinophagales bacterium]|nr:hypothetical protein [Chitinophagales bacterium]MDW8393845.1 hypothetical protein [Chitinophagales bacterium]